MGEEVGSLRADLGIDTSGWFDGLRGAQSQLQGFAKGVQSELAALGDKVRNVGIGLTVGITAPFAAMTIASGRGAGGFEAAMNKVQAALKGISGEQLKQLSGQARELGPAVGKSAVEAADGIETLALAGMSAGAILNGGLDATLKLAGANMADLGSAGALVTDVMSQFGKTSSNLPAIINQITGALDSSKFAFIDVQQAFSQAGGVAGAAGVSFEDFNTAIAGTSTVFGSGADAGTSFKTFITSLNAKSDDAARAMKKLGLEFYHTSGSMKGQMKDLGDIAGQLQSTIGKLDEKSAGDALFTLFGNDAMRSAIGLMQLGKTGFEELQATIAQGDAGAKLAVQMQGYEAAVNRLKASIEAAKISIGDTGLLDAFTALTSALNGVVAGIAAANPTLLKIGTILYGVAAAIGPVTLALLGMAKIGLVLAAARFGTLAFGIAALINPMGALVVVLLKLTAALAGASSVLSLLATSMLRFAGPIGLAVTALTLLYMWTNRTRVASDEYTAASKELAAAQTKNAEITQILASATGETRRQALASALAARREAVEHLKNAKAKLVSAMAARQLAAASAAKAVSDSRFRINAGGPDAVLGAIQRGDRTMAQAEVNQKAAMEDLRGYIGEVDTLTKGIKAAVLVGNGEKIAMDFDKPEAPKKAREARTPRERKATGPSAEDLAARRADLALQQQLAVAQERLDYEEVRRIQDLIDLKQQERALDDAGLSKADAKIGAARNMADLQAARQEGNDKELEQAGLELDLQAAEIRGDQVFVRMKQDELYLRNQIDQLRRDGMSLANAEILAASRLAVLEAARLDAMKQLNGERERDRQIELARARGDSAQVIRRLERDAEIAKAAKVYEQDGRVSPSVARARAERDVAEGERAAMQGRFREAFGGGMRAALDGDLKGFFKNWIADRTAKGLEDALNNVADLLYTLFADAMKGGAGGAGGGLKGILVGVASALGSAFGGGGKTNSGYKVGDMPGFSTGGSFEVGGRGGIDQNVIAFRATKGEMVNIRKPGSNDNGGGRSVVVQQSISFSGGVDLATRGEVYRVADAARQAAINGIREADRRRG